jgi:hypothetical protein
MAFAYRQINQEVEDLCQGDVLRPNDTLTKVLLSVHPHFADRSQYPLFMVLTQTCDLVRRSEYHGASPCKSYYISIAAVRPFPVALQREVSKYQRSDTEQANDLCGLEHQHKVRGFLEKLLNNNEDGFFYLHNSEDGSIPEPMCAFLPVSIALRSRALRDLSISSRRRPDTGIPGEAWMACRQLLLQGCNSRLGAGHAERGRFQGDGG